MNKFVQIISSTRNETLKRRAVQIARSAQIAQENLINKIKQQLTQEELRVQALIDMGPDTTDSLRPSSKDWNPEKWVNELQKAKETHYELKISLKLAKETYDDLFSVVPGTEEVADQMFTPMGEIEDTVD